MTTRDPRLDPEPRDVIKAKGFTFLVEDVEGERIWFEKITPKGRHQRGWAWLDDWRRDLAEASK